MVREPTDKEILEAVRSWGRGGTPTYVVRYRLATKGFSVSTPWVLRRLKRAERNGRVRRIPSSYAVMICWGARDDETTDD